MTKAMQISLKAGERVYINGAVVRADRKVTLELLNDVTFLLEGHVLQAAETTTPLRQVYFVLQTMLMDPREAKRARELFHQLHAKTIESFRNDTIVTVLASIAELVDSDRVFEALRALRGLFPIESAILARGAAISPQAA